MRIHTELPEWMTHLYIEGNEGEPQGEPAGGTGTPPEGDPAGGKGAEGDEPDDADLDDKDLSGLKNGIKSERLITRAKTRELKEAQTKLKEAEARLKEIDDKDKSEVDKAKEAQAKADAKVAKLAEGYRNTALQRAVEKAARDAKFIDPDDAYKALDLEEIEVTQDDDDPAKVIVDTKAVAKAVEALAKKKPYLTGEPAGDGQPSGSKFGGGNNKDGKGMSEEELRVKYPALRN